MIASTYHLGIDVGSTTAKAVVFDPLAQRVLFSRYVRHNAHQVETVASLLRTVAKEFPECSVRLVACGSGGTTIADVLGVPFVQEVVANSLAVRRDHENVRCAIELGGQDAKMVFFERDEKSGATTVADMRMNGSCAGGTGAFIDEMAALLKVPVEQFDELAARAIGSPGIGPLRRLREDRHPAPAQPGSFEGGPGAVVVSCHREADDRRLGAGPRHPSARHLRGRPANLQPDARARVR